MPINIGERAESFSNPMGLLADCHRRIEMFLRSLIAVAAQAQDGKLTAEQHPALANALRYFFEAAPRHTADEEQSLFPRLRRLDNPEVRAAMAQMETLEREHRVAEELHARVDTLGRRWIAAGSLAVTELTEMRSALAELKAIYDRHIAIEDEQVFPLAKKALAIEEQKAVGEEMASRRGAKTCEP